MRLAAIALFLFASCANSDAQTAAVDGAEIVWAGLYRARIVGTIEQPNTAIGRTNRLDNIEKLEATTTVPARLGVSFGFEYRLSGSPQGEGATVEIVVVLPRAGLLNPATGKRVHRETWRPSPVTIGASTIIGYVLEADWELVPGLWRFEIWHGGRKAGEQTFCLVQQEGSARPDDQQAEEERCHSAATA